MANNSIRPTLTKGVAKVPVIMQLEALECGAAALAMIMAYYGKWVPLEQVRLDCGVSRDGSKARNIYQAAEHYGFDVEAWHMDPESLKNKGRFPCILHWNMNHFVVLRGFRGKYAYLNDPARGEIKVTLEEFDRSFTGVVIIPVPSERFEPGGKRKSTIDFAKKRLTGARSALVFVMLTTAISYLFGIVNSVTSRIFMDRLLSGRNRDWLIPFLIVLSVLAAIQLAVAWAQTVSSLKINGKMAVVGSSSYMWKVLHLPMEFFSQRLAGDIQSRTALNASIAGTLVNTLAPVVLNTAMMVFYLVVMLSQSVLLTLIGIGTILINMGMAGVISRRRINITRVQMRDQGKLEAATVTGIDMIETIKSGGAEEGFFRKWAGYQAAVNVQTVNAEKTNRYLGMIPAFFSTIANYAVLVLGVWLVMQGQFSLGGVMMFQGFLGSFLSPAMTLIGTGQTIQEMRTQMERVEDVMAYPEDENTREYTEKEIKDKQTEENGAANETVSVRAVSDDGNLEKLRGNIELKDVTFGYSCLDAPLIRDFSLRLTTGQQVALVGASGCGKSTVSRLVSGLYQPWSGEILFDGRPRSAWPRDVITGSLAVVDQEIILFADTVSANIRMWDSSIKDFEMILAARDAQIHEDIIHLPGGYQHKLSAGGRELSGGQRQRLEIARVLAQDPTILILDEATSALDAQTEYEVVKAIRERGITCIIAAHRLSTVRDCDEIIVLEKGLVTERGTHDELMRMGGAYADLVADE